MDRVLDDLFHQVRFADRAIHHVVAAGLARDFRQFDLFKGFAHGRHLGHEPFLHQATLLTARVGVQLVVETNGGEFFLPEPSLQRHIEADIHRGPVAGQYHHVLDLSRKPHTERAFQPGRNRVLVAEERMNIVDAHVRKDQAGATGGPHHHGILRGGQRRQDIPERHGLRTPGTQRMLFNQFLRGPDILPPAAILPIRGAFHQILVFRRHDFEHFRGYFNSFLTHGRLLAHIQNYHVHSAYRVDGSDERMPRQLPRPARLSDFRPKCFFRSAAMTSGGMVMPPQT